MDDTGWFLLCQVVENYSNKPVLDWLVIVPVDTYMQRVRRGNRCSSATEGNIQNMHWTTLLSTSAAGWIPLTWTHTLQTHTVSLTLVVKLSVCNLFGQMLFLYVTYSICRMEISCDLNIKNKIAAYFLTYSNSVLYRYYLWSALL